MRFAQTSAITAALLAALVTGCSTTNTDGQSGAAVENRNPTASSSGVGGQGGALSPLKDPNNILSKRSVYFDYDKYEVKTEYKQLVAAHAKYLSENKTAKVLIQGNTDERGSREYNLALGQKRSDAVKKALTLLGAKDDQIESVSLGEEKPKAEGHDEAAYAENRRADILYNGEY
ncbi:outer membrane protein, porin-associated lipoprotein [Oryzomicrobium terrae]|uniref:Peptidoglycan-associated lipoprotein n=1 Tax=Oryzomicrobium terrae TaxID=1735038 RepID=A0A5C1E496_9RHOO|nr:peptidoglycan-associated lipoprotein Pal [Oryzomicrobium terrae]QEL63746.1 outer membrane protein, porin-associated lipoprotein [Oryzomicrobium terrae]